MSCADRHAHLKTNEREFREQLDIIGVLRRTRRRPPLLLGNCQQCGSTLSLRLP